jgi:glycerol kinase
LNEFIIGIDAGTTGIRALCFNKEGKVISHAYEEFEQIFPKPAWVEHDANEIWTKTEKLISKAISAGKLKKSDAVAIGITNQRETTVIFDTNGEPIYNAIVWQCRRTTDQCQKIKDNKLEQEFIVKTGLMVDSYFSGTKISWILKNVKGAKQRAEKGELLFGTIDTWLLYKLTGGKSHKTDYTNASRTLIYNIKEKVWDKDLMKLLDIPQNLVLPEVQNSSSEFGTTLGVKNLPDGILVASLVGDQQGALFGQMCTNVGEAKNTYGTGCFLLFQIGDTFKVSAHKLITTLACKEDGSPTYAFEGSVFIGGAVMQWLRDSMQFFKKASESEAMIQSLTSEDDVVFVPAFSGLGAPHWDQNARGAIFGLTRDTSKAQIARAALKSIALQSYELVQAIEKDTGEHLKVLKVDGGATSNNYLMQYQADILGKKVVRPSNIETTVLGAAYLAGLKTKFYPSLNALKSKDEGSTEFKPSMKANVREKEINRWEEAIKKVKTN